MDFPAVESAHKKWPRLKPKLGARFTNDAVARAFINERYHDPIGDARKAPKRLIETDGFAKKDRITHRFEITSLKDIDDEVKKWLKIAYERDA